MECITITKYLLFLIFQLNHINHAEYQNTVGHFPDMKNKIYTYTFCISFVKFGDILLHHRHSVNRYGLCILIYAKIVMNPWLKNKHNNLISKHFITNKRFLIYTIWGHLIRRKGSRKFP